ncbi:MAG: rhodanese-like domain-containing protein [Desulfobacterales bacterium]|jgi:rhodanese-related sulfurtransferase
MPPSIDINTLKKRLTDETTILLDVRRRADYEATPRKIAGAAWQDPEKVDTWCGKLPTGKRPVVYCVKGGSVSQTVTDKLRGEGFDAVFLEGGLKAWIDSGHSVQDVRS